MKNTVKQIGIIALAAIIGLFITTCEGPMGPEGTHGNTPWICIDGFWHFGGTPDACNENCTGITVGGGTTTGQTQLVITGSTRTTYCKDIAFGTSGLIVSFMFGDTLIPIPATNYVLIWSEGLLTGGSTAITAEAGTKTIYVVDFAGRLGEFEITVLLEHAYRTTPAACTTASIPSDCSNCGVEDPRPVAPALGHTFSTIPATCTEDSKPGDCSRENCGVEDLRPVVPAGHVVYTGVVTTPPNFATSTAGVKTGTCTLCGESGITQPIPIYAIGDIGPGGGVIFFVADGVTQYESYESEPFTIGSPFTMNGFNMTDSDNKYYYLEASLEIFEFHQWSTTNYNVETGTAIGTGRENTALMIAGGTAPAALVCREYDGGGKNDWFLPSRDELNQMIKFEEGFINDYEDYFYYIWRNKSFWSSSQFDINFAWNQFVMADNRGSSFYTINKGFINYMDYYMSTVRPIRAF